MLRERRDLYRGRKREGLGGGLPTYPSFFILPSSPVYLSIPPPIPFRDSFTLRISRAGDRASNPFPDAFLIVWESRHGWDGVGVVGVTVSVGRGAHLHFVIHVGNVKLVSNQPIKMRC